MKDPGDPNAALLPTLDAARAAASPEVAKLLDGEPSAQRVAAIVLEADFLRRDTWDEEVELAPPLFERYPRDMPAPPTDFRAAGYQLVDAGRPSRRARCGNCFLSPGTVMCARCFGQPRMDEGPCSYCNGDEVTCSLCEGTGETVRATIRHVNDRPIAVRRTLLPALPAAVRACVEAVVAEVHAPPEAHRFALQANVVESAYRGASAVRAPEFGGHVFGDALAAAIDVVAELDRTTTHVVRRDVRAYAWPLLVVAVDGAEGTVALLHDAAGALRVAIGSPGGGFLAGST